VISRLWEGVVWRLTSSIGPCIRVLLRSGGV
jgi:hypothetical protein